MLLDPQIVKSHVKNVTGVLHIGAHNCEEMTFYTDVLGISSHHIYWVEAIPFKVQEAQNRQIPNVYQAIIGEYDEESVSFHVSNNIQSSSILELGTHATEHPHVWYVDSYQGVTTTIDTFFLQHTIDPSTINFWNLDIQGAELMALRGATQSLSYVDYLYLEVNEKELYKGCGRLEEMDKFLKDKGFERILTDMTPHGWGDALYKSMKR